MSVIIRAARPEDAQAIIDVHEASVLAVGGCYYTSEQLRRWAGPRRPEDYLGCIQSTEFSVAESAGRIVAYGNMVLSESVVRSVYVAPDFARTGIGARLLQHLIDVARQHGIQSLSLRSSLNAVLFYEARGFRRVSNAVHQFLNGGRLEVVNMELNLVGPRPRQPQ